MTLFTFAPQADRKALRNVTALAVCAGAAVVLFLSLGLRFNLTSSHAPVGLWRACPAAGAIQIGDVITYDIREFYAAKPEMTEDRLTFAAPRIMKRVAALPGALIELSGDALVVDGKEYSQARLAKGWRKVDYPLVVPEGTVWLMDDVLAAYDSRYHGPLPLRLVKEKNEPLWVRERRPAAQ